jgi:hypothetical protein
MSNLARELIGTTCCCGQPKATKQTFCPKCYYSLPQAMQRALYRRMGEGYEEAYFRARERLGFGVRQ